MRYFLQLVILAGLSTISSCAPCFHNCGSTTNEGQGEDSFEFNEESLGNVKESTSMPPQQVGDNLKGALRGSGAYISRPSLESSDMQAISSPGELFYEPQGCTQNFSFAKKGGQGGENTTVTFDGSEIKSVIRKKKSVILTVPNTQSETLADNEEVSTQEFETLHFTFDQWSLAKNIEAGFAQLFISCTIDEQKTAPDKVEAS